MQFFAFEYEDEDEDQIEQIQQGNWWKQSEELFHQNSVRVRVNKEVFLGKLSTQF